MKTKNSSLENKIHKIIVNTLGGIVATCMLIQAGLNIYTDHKYVKNLHSKYQQSTTISKDYHVVLHREGDLLHRIFDYDKDGIFDEVWIHKGSDSIRLKRKAFGKGYYEKYQQMFDSGNKIYGSLK